MTLRVPSKGSILSGTVGCWRGPEGCEVIVEVAVRLHVWPVHPSEGCGFEVDVVEATAEGQPFELTDAEVDRAVEQLAGH